MTMPACDLALEHVAAGYGGDDAVRDLTLHCAPGTITAILGENGSGKSTALHVAAGLLAPRRGAVRAGDHTLTATGPSRTAWRARVGFVMHDPDDQLFGSSVCEDIGFGPVNLGLSHDEVGRRVDEASAALDLDELHDAAPHVLSHGQKLRTVIAGIVAMQPSVLLFDEPTSGLDASSAEAFEVLLLRLRRDGRTIVLSTHDVDLAWRIADAVAVLDRGRTVAQGSISHVLGSGAACACIGVRTPSAVAVCDRLAAIGLMPRGMRSPRTLSDALRLVAPPTTHPDGVSA
ncbi:MAG: ABC transporter ATP-binding protein [Gemmatimonadetes bacterium]|nr:ABC transporter ATP-binding protein [Gemmatimonadota bacterium]